MMKIIVLILNKANLTRPCAQQCQAQGLVFVLDKIRFDLGQNWDV